MGKNTIIYKKDRARKCVCVCVCVCVGEKREQNTTDDVVVDVRPMKGTHRVTYINENYFACSGCPPSKNYVITSLEEK